MICPYCSLYISQDDTPTCPRCGKALGGAWTNGENFGPPVNPMEQAPTVFSSGSFPSGQGTPVSPSVSGPSQPFYAPGQPPTSSGNVGMSPGAPVMPPAWGAPAPMPPAVPPRKSRTGWIIGALVVIIVLLACGLGVSLIALHGQSNKQGAAPTTLSGPTFTPSETVLFQDPLTSDVNGWLVDSHCLFKNGSYHIVASYLCYAPAGSISDATISVDVQQISGPLTWFYGLMLRRASTGNYYAFYIDSNSKWGFSKHVNGTRSDVIPYQFNAAVKGGLNVKNTLLVHMKGSHFDFYINGTKVGQVDDTTYTSGLSGLFGNDNIDVAYNNFKITS
jgi:hypothetical protein